MQPRSHGPQKWQGPRPLMGRVRLAVREGMTVRPSFSLVDVYKIRWPSYRVAEKALRLRRDHVIAS